MSRQNTKRCPQCNDTGWVIASDGSNRYIRCDCEKQTSRLIENLIEASNIPKPLQENYQFSEWASRNEYPSIRDAYTKAQEFYLEYPLFTGPHCGLLLQGPVGTGKTHLAVAILNELIHEKQVSCLFHDFSELLALIKSTYSPDGDLSTHEVFRRIYDVDVLCIDDLGAERSSEWVLDILGLIVNHRYMHRKPVIITTNHLDDEEALIRCGALEDADKEARAALKKWQNVQGAILSQRVGPRIRSRLFEMCETVLVMANDFRQQR